MTPPPPAGDRAKSTQAAAKLELPQSIYRFWAFLGSLGPDETQALRDLNVRPFGILDLFADAGRKTRNGIDTRCGTALEAVRTVLERYWRDLDDMQGEEEAPARPLAPGPAARCPDGR